MRELNRLGVTGAIDAGGGFQNYPEDYAVIQKLADDGQLTIRLAYNLFTQKPKGEKEDFLNWTKTSKYKQGDDYFRHNGAGEMLVFSAADFEDFRQPRPDMPPEMEGELEEVVRVLAQNRWPWRLHATYDETISRALDVFETVNQDIPLDGLNWFFDHAETISERRSTASRRSAAASPCSTAWPIRASISSSATAPARPRRRRRSRSMLEKGVKVSAGTDATRVASYNPWVSLAWLVTGKTVGGLQLYPQRNCLDRETALRMWTENVTWFSNEEGKKGRIEVGQLADLIVPDRDFFACAEDEIADTTSELTMVGGKVVYGAGDFASLDEGRAAAGDAGLVAGAHLRRLRGLGRAKRAAQPALAPQARHELRLRERLQRPRPRPCQRVVEQAADRRSEELLGRARLRLLGSLETRAPKQRAIHERGQLPDRLWRSARPFLPELRLSLERCVESLNNANPALVERHRVQNLIACPSMVNLRINRGSLP